MLAHRATRGFAHPQAAEKNLLFPQFYRLTRQKGPPIHPASPDAGDEFATVFF
jgi:hypothetical protein